MGKETVAQIATGLGVGTLMVFLSLVLVDALIAIIMNSKHKIPDIALGVALVFVLVCFLIAIVCRHII